jgi:hypothetical protein
MFHALGADEDGIFTLQVLPKVFSTRNFHHHCDSRSQARFPGIATATAASHNEENVAVSMNKVSSANNLIEQRSSFMCRLILPERLLIVLPLHIKRACLGFGAVARAEGSFEAARYFYRQRQTYRDTF